MVLLHGERVFETHWSTQLHSDDVDSRAKTVDMEELMIANKMRLTYDVDEATRSVAIRRASGALAESTIT